MTLTLNEKEIAAQQLTERWRILARLIEYANQLEASGKRDPDVFKSSRAVAYIRWRNVFETELAAVQAVADAVEAGTKLDTDQLRTARIAADKLLDIVLEAEDRFPASDNDPSSGIAPSTMQAQAAMQASSDFVAESATQTTT